MSQAQRDTPPAGSQRGRLARPLDALAFLLPMIVFYEIVSYSSSDRVIAFNLLRMFLELFGEVGRWAPGLAVVVILLATHAASGERWVVHHRTVAWMYAEATLLAVPLLGLNWLIPLAGETGVGPGLIARVGLYVGAGIYEELVFRLILISLIMIVGVDLLRCKTPAVATVAVVLSSLLFSAHHHRPLGIEEFDLMRFTFRFLAGVYLALIFWYRGYGPAAGCHAAYNASLLLLGAVGY